MNIKDQTKKERFGGQNLPKLHGHTKITLTNVKTGEVEVVEKDNLVTNAVANIYANNIFGAANYNKMTPIHDMFGGVLCFEDTQDTTLTLPLNNNDNALTACAGQTAHSTASTVRGNPNGALTGETPDGLGYVYTWDFSTTQGNGQISSLSLCHKWGGDIGLKPYAAEANEFPFVISSNKTKQLLKGYDADFVFDDYLLGLIECDIANETGLHCAISGGSYGGDTLTVSEVSIPLINQGINNDLAECAVTATHTVTLTRTFYNRYSAICSDDNYIYVITAGSSSGAHTLQIDKVSKTTWTATAADITDANMNLGTADAGVNFMENCGVMMNKTIVSGGYLYWIDAAGTSFYKLNLTNSADITHLTTNLTSSADLNKGGLVELSEGLVLGNNFIINYNTVYPVASQTSFETVVTAHGGDVKMVRFCKSGDLYYLWSWGSPDYVEMTLYTGVAFPTLYLGTIQNITPVTKTNDKTMQIEYTITLANP